MAEHGTTREDLEQLVNIAKARVKTARNHLNAAVEANRQNPAQGKTLAARQSEDRLTREFRDAQQKTKRAELDLQSFDRAAAFNSQEIASDREAKAKPRSILERIQSPKTNTKRKTDRTRGFRRRRDRDDEFER